MKNLFLKTLVIGLFLLALPMKEFGQAPKFGHDSSTIDFDITEIALFDERVFFIYHLIHDGRFNVVNSENEGVFVISADPGYNELDLRSEFYDFREQTANLFSGMDKEQAAETAMAYKAMLPNEITHSLMMDVYIKSRQNNMCALADPFCTDNGMYEFPAGVDAGSGESGPDYACLSSTPNPAWYYMRIGTSGNINIYMYSTPSEDIDFCCWGPFDDPIAPCPNGLTYEKKVSCSYSASSTETCAIPVSAQTGQYFIMVITNYSNHACNINFSKISGNGTTDCGIMPPLVNNDGPYCVADAIHLTANGQAGASYYWTGPNNYSSNHQNPIINNCNLSHSGNYTCTISLNGQTNSSSTTVAVYARPTANFSATTVCKGEATQFNNTSTTVPANQPMFYTWDFGDGQTSTQQNPTHQFATAGNHNVTLSVTCGRDACVSTKSLNVIVYENPVANAGPDQSVQYGESAQLRGSGGNGTFNYHWEPADKVVNPNAQNTQTIGMSEATTFTLTVTHPQGGCSSTDEINVLVEGSNMTATASANPPAICLGETSQLSALAIGGTGSYSYSWSPSLGLSDPLSPNPIATPSNNTTYSCTVNDGYSTQTVTTSVVVNQPEYLETTEYICPDETYNFYGTEYSDEDDYEYITTTAQGCEKIITLHLRHYPSYDNAHTTTASICHGDSYLFHGHYYYATNLYPETLQTIHGCDSIVWLNLNVYPANDTTIVDPTICTTQTYNFHGTEYSEDGTIAYFDTIDNHGCLKVEKLVLSVGPYQMPPKEEPRICYAYDDTPSYYWDKTGMTYTQDTYDEIILPDPNGGCDIKHRLDLKFHQEFFQSDALTVCDSYEWPVIPGSHYTQTNHHLVKTFHDVGGNGFACDSTYVLDLTVNHSDISEKEVLNQCNQYEWQFGWNNENYLFTEEGNYTKTIDTQLGCDSIVTLKLQLDYTPSFPKIEGKTWVVGGSEFQYSIEQYRIETHPKSTHKTDWALFDKDGNPFDKWDIRQYDNGDKCYLYIYTFERDSIRLQAHTESTRCDCGEDEKSIWIKCGYHGTNEDNAPTCKVDIYPNPNDGDMTLSFEDMFGEILIKVYGITGTLVDQFSLYNDQGPFNYIYQSSKLSPGVYFFSIANKKGILTKKVIIID